MTRVELVVPTLGRPSLDLLLETLATNRGPQPERVLVVDDRPEATAPLRLGDLPEAFAERVHVLRGRAAGPAAARNDGWRATAAPWVAFLDDDVVPPADWLERLAADLVHLPADVAGSQGRIEVPLPRHRRPTDWERNVAGLETARWATADMAYRRAALEAAGGFDERFPRAYREDADLALRLVERDWRLVRGRRTVTHPVRPAGRWVSVRLQAGNADDVLMWALHGRDWRRRASAAPGRRARHLTTTAAGALGVVGLLTGRRLLARGGLGTWIAGTAELAWRRIAPGPRTPGEIATMALTSTVLPAAATWHWLRGWTRLPRLLAAPAAGAPAGSSPRPPKAPAAVLLDRDGTLVVDVPYNGDPALVQPMPGARRALDRLRAAGVPLAVISNQSAIGRGWLVREQVDAVNDRVEELLGPLGPFCICPHAPAARCACRKPAGGLVREAARRLGVDPSRCAVIGDIGADVEAARAAGARPVLVPTARTLLAEIDAAPAVARDLDAAVDLLLGGRS